MADATFRQKKTVSSEISQQTDLVSNLSQFFSKKSFFPTKKTARSEIGARLPRACVEMISRARKIKKSFEKWKKTKSGIGDFKKAREAETKEATTDFELGLAFLLKF